LALIGDLLRAGTCLTPVGNIDSRYLRYIRYIYVALLCTYLARLYPSVPISTRAIYCWSSVPRALPVVASLWSSCRPYSVPSLDSFPSTCRETGGKEARLARIKYETCRTSPPRKHTPPKSSRRRLLAGICGHFTVQAVATEYIQGRTGSGIIVSFRHGRGQEAR